MPELSCGQRLCRGGTAGGDETGLFVRPHVSFRARSVTTSHIVRESDCLSRIRRDSAVLENAQALAQVFISGELSILITYTKPLCPSD